MVIEFTAALTAYEQKGFQWVRPRLAPGLIWERELEGEALVVSTGHRFLCCIE